MSALVADTHTLIWYVNSAPQLSAAADAAMRIAEQGGEAIYVPAICVVELCYLVEKGTISEADFDNILTEIKDPDTALAVAALDLVTAEMLRQISRAIVADMPDRIIAATAYALGLPLVTRDSKINKLPNISIIW